VAYAELLQLQQGNEPVAIQSDTEETDEADNNDGAEESKERRNGGKRH